MAKRGRDDDIELPDLTKAPEEMKPIIPLPANVKVETLKVEDSRNPVSTTTVTQKRTREGDVITEVKRQRVSVARPAAIKPVAAAPNLVAVKGSKTVDRCTRCNTFVKKGSSHSLAQCDARIASKKSGVRKPKHGKRRFRATPKRIGNMRKMAIFAASYLSMLSPLKSLEKWATKRSKRLTKSTKETLGRVFVAMRSGPSPKQVESVLKKIGL